MAYWRAPLTEPFPLIMSKHFDLLLQIGRQYKSRATFTFQRARNNMGMRRGRVFGLPMGAVGRKRHWDPLACAHLIVAPRHGERAPYEWQP
ncbi:unnamed protein product, partial [Iphiclides podalirius]